MTTSSVSTSYLGLWDGFWEGRSCDESNLTMSEMVAFLNDDKSIKIVEDWGCGVAILRKYLSPGTTYVGIDASSTGQEAMIADLSTYTSKVDAIYMQHVMEHNWRWKEILLNLLESFTVKAVIVIFTPWHTPTDQHDTEHIITMNTMSKQVALPVLALSKAAIIDIIHQYSPNITYEFKELPNRAMYGQEHVITLSKSKTHNTTTTTVITTQPTTFAATTAVVVIDEKQVKASDKWYSQIGQDRWVCENVFKHRSGGFYVDVGAFDGKDLSNTFVLEHHYGWRGLCVEPMKESFAKLVACRPNSINIPVAAYDKDFQVLEFQCSGVLSGASSHVDHAKGTLVHVPTMTLTSLFKLHDVPKQMDFLSIDAEGSDFHVLQGIDWNVYSFLAITVEHNYVEPIRSNMREFLESKGYTLATSIQWDDIYTFNPNAPKQQPKKILKTVLEPIHLWEDIKDLPDTPPIKIKEKTVIEPPVAGDVRVLEAITGGLGDRLLACLMYATAGLVMGARKVHCSWQGEDIGLVKTCIKLPPNLVFSTSVNEMKDIPILKQKDVLVESLLPNTGWWRFYSTPGFPEFRQDSFEKVYREVAQQMTIDHPILSNLPKLPYAVVHIRGTDRRDDNQEFVASTQNILRQLQQHGIKRWLLVTDDLMFAKTMVTCPTTTPTSSSADQELRDLAILYKAKFIVQHAPNGWSAFSHLVSCWRQIPIINTCPSEKWNYMMHLVMGRNMPPTFFHSQQLQSIINLAKHF